MSGKSTRPKRNLDHWQGVGNGLWRDNQGNEGVKETIIVDPLYDTSNENTIYDYRKETKSPFVRTYGSMLKEKEKPVEGEKGKKETDPNIYMDVVTQYIPHRLNNSPQLTYPESLYVLDRSLEGYETAYNKCGPMVVNDHMIGFNKNGEAKVWVNEEYAHNHPSHPLPNLERTEQIYSLDPKDKNVFYRPADEAAMVENIVNVVGDHCQYGQWRQPFNREVRGLGFQQARNLIQASVNRDRIFMPDRVDLYGHKVRGYRNQFTTTNTTYQTYQPVQQVVQKRVQQVPVLNQPPPPTFHQTTSTIERKTQGFKFNYLPVDEPYHPDVFASRVGEHGSHHGHKY